MEAIVKKIDVELTREFKGLSDQYGVIQHDYIKLIVT